MQMPYLLQFTYFLTYCELSIKLNSAQEALIQSQYVQTQPNT